MNMKNKLFLKEEYDRKNYRVLSIFELQKIRDRL